MNKEEIISLIIKELDKQGWKLYSTIINDGYSDDTLYNLGNLDGIIFIDRNIKRKKSYILKNENFKNITYYKVNIKATEEAEKDRIAYNLEIERLKTLLGDRLEVGGLYRIETNNLKLKGKVVEIDLDDETFYIEDINGFSGYYHLEQTLLTATIERYFNE